PAVIAAGALAAWAKPTPGLEAPDGRWKRLLQGLTIMVATFAVGISPWLVRDWLVAGTPLPPGASKTIFLREYNDIFNYSRTLNLNYYLNMANFSPTWGLRPLIMSKISALASNLLLIGRPTFFALAPLFVIGMLYRNANRHSIPLWRRMEYLPFLCYAVVLYLAMSLLFTFPSPRGSVMHSSGGLIPFVVGAVVADHEGNQAT
ncbi:MAG: hypothetical protein M1319_04935, partial [Chloroflexi bacterium]|nr:hypothetical protein [Chloroflexota bacterium]